MPDTADLSDSNVIPIWAAAGRRRGADAAERVAVVRLDATDNSGATLEWLSRRLHLVREPSHEETMARHHAGHANRRLLAYIADDPCSAWTRRCIDRCSRVLFISSARGPVTESAAVAYAKQMRRDATVVLVNDADAMAPAGGGNWLDHVPAASILHVRSRNQPDHERMLRLVSRTAICVVFSGGGARALAHIGAVKALEENGIAIDMVGGTSMGALIAGQVAQGFTAQTILDRMYRYVVETNPMQDFTLPFVSLVRGRKITRTFKEACEGALIENLWKPFFCVSADLTTGTSVLHQSGPLWQALRASSAIPGIFPPVMDEGRVLVDGGVVDTFPTAAMRALGRGKVVGFVTASDCRIEATDVAVEEKSLLWMLRNGRREMPSISRILMSSGMMTRRPLMAASRAAADVLIEPALSHINMFSFKSFDKAVEAGYRATLQAIPQLKLLNREDTVSVLEAA